MYAIRSYYEWNTGMRHILTAMIFIVSLYADTKTDLFQLFNNKEYKSACKLGMDNYGSYTRDEAFISLYAFSCLNADYIDSYNFV